MKLLALETATDACSVALWWDGEIREAHEIAPRRHTELILPMIDGLCAEAGISAAALDGIAFGAGPGAFTGVRIATSIAQGIALAHELAVVPISTLAVLAQGAWRTLQRRTLVPTLDARRNEIYWGTYTVLVGGDHVLATGPDRVSPPELLTPPAAGDWVATGSGCEALQQLLGSRFGAHIQLLPALRFPHARDVATLGANAFAMGRGFAPDQALPIYLRAAL